VNLTIIATPPRFSHKMRKSQREHKSSASLTKADLAAHAFHKPHSANRTEGAQSSSLSENSSTNRPFLMSMFGDALHRRCGPRDRRCRGAIATHTQSARALPSRKWNRRKSKGVVQNRSILVAEVRYIAKPTTNEPTFRYWRSAA
jgi:hypothetical protein